jgi:hypothetical protein
VLDGNGGVSERATARANAIIRELKAAKGESALTSLAPHVFGVTPEAVRAHMTSDGDSGSALLTDTAPSPGGGLIEKHWNI